MKVCLFVNSFLPKFGGLEIAVHNLANSLCDIGCAVTIIAKRVKAKGQFQYKYNLVRFGYTFPLSGRIGLNYIAGVLSLLLAHKKNKYDVLNCHGVSYAGKITGFTKKFIKIPLVMTPHGKDIQVVKEIGYGLRLDKKWDHVIKKNLLKADTVTAISSAIKNQINFIPSKKIKTIPNGIDTKLFEHKKNKYLHNLFFLNSKTRIILSVGRYHKVKGYEYGIEAFYLVCKMLPGNNLVYVIIGKGTDSLKKKIVQLGLRKKVLILPQQDRETIIKCYQSAWCFFSPSLIEGMSLVSIEAMASGLPLIVTDVPGNIDIVKNNDCGLIVKSKDPVSMAKGIISLIFDTYEYEKFSKNSIKNINAYDWQNIAKNYLRVYREVLKKKTID